MKFGYKPDIRTEKEFLHLKCVSEDNMFDFDGVAHTTSEMIEDLKGGKHSGTSLFVGIGKDSNGETVHTVSDIPSAVRFLEACKDGKAAPPWDRACIRDLVYGFDICRSFIGEIEEDGDVLTVTTGRFVFSGDRAEEVREHCEKALKLHVAKYAYSERMKKCGLVRFDSMSKGVMWNVTERHLSALDRNVPIPGNRHSLGRCTSLSLTFPGYAFEKNNRLCTLHYDGKPYPTDRDIILNRYQYEFPGREPLDVWAMYRKDADAEASFVLCMESGLQMKEDGPVRPDDRTLGKIRQAVENGFQTQDNISVKAGELADLVFQTKKFIKVRFENGPDPDGSGMPFRISGDREGYFWKTDRCLSYQWDKKGKARPKPCVCVMRKGDLPLLSDPSFPDNADICAEVRDVKISFDSPLGKDVDKIGMSGTEHKLNTDAVFICPKGGKNLPLEMLEEVVGAVGEKDIRIGTGEHSEKTLKLYAGALREFGKYYRGEKRISLYPTKEAMVAAAQRRYWESPTRRLWTNEMKRLKMGLSPEEYEERFLKKKGRGR